MIEPPRLGRKLVELDQNEFGDDRELEQGKVINANWSQFEAKRSSMHHVKLERPILLGADLRQVGLIDVRIDQGILSGMIAVESLWRRVEVTGSRLDGMIGYSSQMTDVLITGSRLDQANFRSVKMRHVSFQSVSLREVDFSGAIMNDVEFIDTDITGADFSRARMKKVDLRHAHFDYLNGFTGLRGAIMTYSQVLQLAPILARQAGIVIEELMPGADA